MGRFINADVLAATGQGLLGNNMFVYCNNGPILRSDCSGMFSVSGAIIGGLTSFVTACATGDSLADSLWEGAKGALSGGLETFAVVAYVAIAVFDFNSYMMQGMDIWTALGLTALSFGTSFLSASLLGKLLKCNFDKFTEVVVDLTFGEAISLTTTAITTSVSNNHPERSTNVGTSDTYNPPAAPPTYFGGGPGGGPFNTYFCFF